MRIPQRQFLGLRELLEGTEAGLLKKEAGWVYYYNLVRPHYGAGMDGKPPFQKLRELGYNLPEEFALFPPVVLGSFSATWALESGNNFLAYYGRAIIEWLLLVCE